MGLGVMGRNLALNVERNGYSVAVWNLEPEMTESFLQGSAEGLQFTGFQDIPEFVEGLARPRRILIMIKSGAPVDQTIEKLLPHLDQGDILIDGGNSHFQDTVRRQQSLSESGIHFVGMGVSGGEEGALKGPSLMPGGSPEAYRELAPVLESIAAQVKDGPCVTHVGPDGAGHFVKMVHNGIEYGNMQLIAETYDLMKRLLNMSAAEMSAVFEKWNQGRLDSFLIEITATIFRVEDPETGKPLVEMILDQAGQKGTGKWTSEVALDYGIPIPTIQAAVEARFLSALKEQRRQAAEILMGPEDRPFNHNREDFLSALESALYSGLISSYAQGMALIQEVSGDRRWNVKLPEVSRIWKGGCIIRARLLEVIQQAFQRAPQLANLMLDEEVSAVLKQSHTDWRTVVSTAQLCGIPVPALAAGLNYYDSYRTARLPQNLTQAQRDLFGSHRYQRTDRPQAETVHTEWGNLVH